MRSGKGYSQQRPNAQGVQATTSVYGSTIPTIYGLMRTQLYLIWLQNVRLAGQSLKSKKKKQPDYVANADFLIGSNPLQHALQFWMNNNQKLDLIYSTYTTTVSSSTVTIPDSHFYAVIGVTVEESYSVTVDDYAGPGSDTLSGTWEHPLWNTILLGPNPTNGNAYRNYPYIYTHYVGYGESPTISLDGGSGGFFNGKTVTISYAALDPSANEFSLVNANPPISPLAALQLAWESQLGNGPEYASPEDFTAQQFIYPPFAGVGSENLDLGSGGVLPQLLAEVQGMSIYADGSADFMDMIEDTLCSGICQCAIAPTAGTYSAIHHGLNCFDFPGAVQKVYLEVSGAETVATFGLPNAAGNILFVFVRYSGSATVPTISDTASNSYTLISNTPPSGGSEGQGIWYAIAKSAATNQITISGSGIDTQLVALELSGIDTFDASTATSGSGGTPTGSITTTGAAGRGELILAVLNTVSGGAAGFEASIHWDVMAGSYSAGLAATMQRTVYNPGTYSITSGGAAVGTWTLVLLAFKLSVPPPFVEPLGYIIDPTSLEYARSQCRANGLFGSMVMDSQRNASDWLQDVFDAANTWPVWSGFVLKFVPKSEVSFAGNGAVYVALQSGANVPILTQGDFVAGKGDDVLTIDRKAQVDIPNLIQVQYPSRGNDYNDVVASQPESASLATYGIRKESPKRIACITDSTVAQMVLGLMVRDQNYQRNTYKFTLNAKWGLLEAGDVIQVPVALLLQPLQANVGAETLAVRLTSVEESETWELACEAQDYIWGVHAPVAVTVTDPNPYNNPVGYVPALVNPPVILEPVAGLTPNETGFFLWLAISCHDINYGGAQVWMSTDGGNTYTLVGQTSGNATTGVLTADWPAATDPDSTNPLEVDLTESYGTLPNYSVANMDQLLYPYFVSGGAGSPIPYELTCFSNVTLTAANKYTIPAADQIRRDVFGAPNQPGAPNGFGTGVDHPVSAANTISGITTGTYGLKIQTSAAHGFTTGSTVKIPSGIVGTGGLAAYLNGKYWQITVDDTTHFDLNGTSFAVVTFDEAHTIPSTGPYTVTITNSAGVPITDEGVFYSPSQTRLTAVASSPAQGQYSVNLSTGVYTFNSADAGAAIDINYTSTATYTSGGTVEELPRFAFLDPSETGILKLTLTQAQLNAGEIHIKCCAFNAQGGGFQQLQNVVDYIHTPTGIGTDTGVPYSPIGGQTAGVSAGFNNNALVQTMLEVNYPVTPANNLDSVNTESITFGYIDETNIAEAALLGNVNNTSNPVTINVPSTSFYVGQTFVIGTALELLSVVSIPDSTHVVASRAMGGSTILAHSIGDIAYPLQIKAFNYSYGPGQYIASLSQIGLSSNAAVPHSIYLPAARIYWIQGALSNDFGTTYSTDYFINAPNGERTGFGETDTIGSSQPTNQVVAAGTNVLSAIHSPNVNLIPITITAFLADAASGTDITVTLNVNGSSYATLTITSGNTSSNILSGTVLGALGVIAASAVMTADVSLSNPSASYLGDGLRVAVVF